MFALPLPNHSYGRHDLRGDEAVTDTLVSGDALADSRQERGFCAGIEVPLGGVLPNGLADETQIDASHGSS